MFSTTTMASSTTKPMAMISATNVRLLRLKPSTSMAATVAIIDTPSTAVTMTVAETWRKKAPITTTTSTKVSARVSSTSCSEERMVRVRSLSTSTMTLAGRRAASSGSAAWMRSAVATMLAPGWRRMMMPRPGWPFCHAPTKSFSAPSMTLATSPMRTGTPLRSTMVSCS